MIDIGNLQKMPLPAGTAFRLRRVIRRAIYQELKRSAEVSLILVDEIEIQRLNCEFRGIDAVTDVLSFPANTLEKPMTRAQAKAFGRELVLGDIAICVPRAAQQAAEYGNTLIEELKFLCVHGTLHLLGYDHILSEDETEMRRRQREILRRKER